MFCEVFEVHASIVLAGMMMVVMAWRCRRNPAAGGGSWFGSGGCAFRCAQPDSWPGPPIEAACDAIAVGGGRREQLIERPFMGNHLATKRLGRCAHVVENKLNLPRLILGQRLFCGASTWAGPGC